MSYCPIHKSKINPEHLVCMETKKKNREIPAVTHGDLTHADALYPSFWGELPG